MARCKVCARLSVHALLPFAMQDYDGTYFPQGAFYQHHKSFDDLEIAARQGCDLCHLILDSFMGTPTNDHSPNELFMLWPRTWVCSRHYPIESSMYTRAKGLSDSRVRISIANIPQRTNTVAAISQLDTLLVQVGPTYREERPFVPTLWLTLSTPPDQILELEGFRIGRVQLDPDLGSPTNFCIARKWLADCRFQHDHCLNGDLPALPTRVIDTGVNPDRDYDVRVFCPSPGLRAEYTVLSHCWGGKISPLLTEERLGEFQHCLSYHALPANFQDAITITRELGIRYVWIDSLCIIQDSTEDWLKESKTMASIYRDATLTISAMASRCSTQGILKSAAEGVFEEAALGPPGSATLLHLPEGSVEGDEKPLIVRRHDSDEEDLGKLERCSPLASRAWALQETIMSPRQLFFGRHQIYWRCPAGSQRADASPTDTKWPRETFDKLRSVLHAPVLARQPPVQTALGGFTESDGHIHEASTAAPYDIWDVLRDYNHLVENYVRRNITYDSDKLPAFSAIAQGLAPIIGGSYLAGIWSVDIAHGLSWKAEGRTAKHVPIYRAPSWSWAVTNEEIFLTSRYDTEPHLFGPELVSHRIVLRDSTNPYGEVLPGSSITVRGLTKKLVYSTQVINDWGRGDNIGELRLDNINAEEAIVEEYGDENDEKDSFNFPPEFVVFRREEEGVGDFIVSLIVRFSKHGSCEVDPDYYRPESYIALVLTMKDGQGGKAIATCLVLQEVEVVEKKETKIEFRRVGLLEFHQVEKVGSWERKTVTLE